MVSAYILSGIFFLVRSKVILSLNLLVAGIYFAWFIQDGYKRYIQKRPQIIIRIYTACYVSTSLGLLCSLISSREITGVVNSLV